jgi:hypothetical protein
MFSNYSIKKILPRLVIVVIAVNLSYYICALLVDVSNIIGANIAGVLESLSGSNNFSIGAGTAIMALIGILIALIVGGAAALLAVIMIFACLTLRDLAITALIIVSPIAFVLYLLPNTEKLFKKWFNEFTRMLFIYPMLAVVWGISMFMIGLINGHGIEDTIMKIMLLIAPAVAILPIMKMGGQAMGAIAKGVRSAADKTGASNWAKKRDEVRRGTQMARTPGLRNFGAKTALREDRMKAMQSANRASYANRGGRFGRPGPRDILQRTMTEQSKEQLAKSQAVTDYAGEITKDKSKLTKGMNDAQKRQVNAQAQHVLNQQANKEIDAHVSSLKMDNLTIAQLHAKLSDKNVSKAERAAAAKVISEKGSASDVFKAYQSIQSQGKDMGTDTAEGGAARSALASHEAAGQIPNLQRAMTNGEDLKKSVDAGMQQVDATAIRRISPNTIQGAAAEGLMSAESVSHLVKVGNEINANSATMGGELAPGITATINGISPAEHQIHGPAASTPPPATPTP